MRIKDLLSLLNNGATKINIFDEDGVLLFRSVWFNDLNKKLLNKKIKHLEIKDYLLNIFL